MQRGRSPTGSKLNGHRGAFCPKELERLINFTSRLQGYRGVNFTTQPEIEDATLGEGAVTLLRKKERKTTLAKSGRLHQGKGKVTCPERQGPTKQTKRK
eukprot:974754-Pelagomonas_calceolata.AAC.3